MFMKTLKDYIKLLEDSEPSAELQAVGVTTDDDADYDVDPTGMTIKQEPLPPVSISKMFTSPSQGGLPAHNISVTPNPTDFATGYKPTEENIELLRNALKAGGIPMPDEDSELANDSGIDVTISDNSFSAGGWGEAADRLLQILQNAGLADENGEATWPQSPATSEEPKEVTEETDDAVSRVIQLSHEMQKR